MRHFYWVEEGVLAASEEPGYHDALNEDMEFLRRKSIRAIVSLTEYGIPSGHPDGFDHFHIPIEDFTAPAPEQIDAFLSIVGRMEREGKPTLVHCHAGLGRTGTMAACFLVSRGMSAREAVARVRALRPGSVEMDEQERAVHLFEERHRNT